MLSAVRRTPILHQRSAQAPAQVPSQAARPPRAARGLTVKSSAAGPGADAAPSPVRQVLSGVVAGIYKMSAATQQTDPRLPVLWQGIMKLDKAAVEAALAGGADPNEPSPTGETPLLYIAKAGHYKYRPAEIPTTLIKGGANLEARNAEGNTPLEVSLLSGWQNLAYLFIDSGASTAGVGGIKARLTCPDCKRVVAQFNL